MRIVSGTHRGRRFHPPKNLPVRPTTDFAKEGLFNILRNYKDISSTSVLDLCAGTGNMTYEFASRGASSIVAVDQNLACIKYIKQVIHEFEFTQIRPLKLELFAFLKKLNEKYDIIFADPPYALDGVENLPDLILSKNSLNKGGLLVIEHGKEISFKDHACFSSTRKFGNVNFTFFEPNIVST